VLCQIASTGTRSATGARNCECIHALANSVGVCALQFAAGTLHVGHPALTSKLMSGVFHLHPSLWVAVSGLTIEEGAVATVKDIDFGVGEARVVLLVDSAIVCSDEFCPGVN